MAYEPKIGGHLHIQLLTDMRSENEDDIRDLNRLAQAAGNDGTKVMILECLVRAHKRTAHIDGLIKIYKGGGD